MMVHKRNCCGNFVFRSEYTYYASYEKNNPVVDFNQRPWECTDESNYWIV